MIIKYRALNGGWGFVDNISAITNQEYSSSVVMHQVREEINKGDREEHTQEGFGTITKMHNDIFVGLSDIIYEELEDGSYTTLSLISEEFLPTDELDTTVSIIVCNNKWREEFDRIVLFANREVYLLNDKGETIERLN